MLAAAVVLGAADAMPAAGVADADGDGGGREEGCSTGMTCASAGVKTSDSKSSRIERREGESFLGGPSSQSGDAKWRPEGMRLRAQQTAVFLTLTLLQTKNMS